MGLIKWGLVVHTTTMFSFLTINCCMNFAIQSISYIDNRAFTRDGMFPGPFVYQLYIYSEPINVVPSVMFYLNNWLADGLLLYRCYIIYGKNPWIMVFPFLIYLTSLATGVIAVAQIIRPDIILHPAILFDLIYLPISLSLTILLTLMIITRLILHSRKLQRATGSWANASGPYKAIVTMFVESYALYAVTFIVALGLEWVGNSFQYVFIPILAGTQVITPFLVILRVANRRALKSNTIPSERLGSIRFRSQGGSTIGDGTISDGNPVMSVGMDDPDTPGERDPMIENVIDEVPR